MPVTFIIAEPTPAFMTEVRGQGFRVCTRGGGAVDVTVATEEDACFMAKLIAALDMVAVFRC